MKKIIFIPFLLFHSFIFSQAGTDTVQKLLSTSEQLRFDDPEKALGFAERALELASRLKDSSAMGYAYNNAGIQHYILGEYEAAMKYYFKALKLFERLGEERGVASSLINIGLYNSDQKNYNEALKYFSEAVTHYEKAGWKKGLSNAYNNLGITYWRKKDFSKSLEYHRKALRIREANNDSAGISSSYNNIGTLYEDLGDYNNAIQYYLKSYAIDSLQRKKESIKIDLSNLASLHLKIGKPDAALDYALLSKHYADEMGDNRIKEDIYYNLYEIYSAKKNNPKAIEYLKLYADIKDSIYQDEISRNMSDMQAKYETEKKDKTIAQQQAEAKQQEIERNSILAGLVLVLLLAVLAIVLAYFIYRGYKLKKKANDLLTQWNLQIAHQKKEITDSINYAKKIQNSILPPDWLVKKLLPDSFILYKAKDIVSGDFYWVEQKNNIVLFAAVDCTGHGVPGAMMSVLGFNLLSQAVEKGLTKPSEILQHLDYGVNQVLRQSTEADTVKDGMDLALCTVDFEKKELQYAGAYNNLWVVKHSTKELFEVKADKFPIGSNVDGIADIFSNHVLKLDSGDAVYVFSDGYADQFGGNAGKKFKYKPIKELLISIHSKPMNEQKQILDNTIEKWRGDLEQVDDILVMGVRI